MSPLVREQIMIITPSKNSIYSLKNFLKMQGFSLISLLSYFYLYGILFCIYDCYTIDNQSNPIHTRQDSFAYSLSWGLDHFFHPMAIILWVLIFTKIVSRRPWKEILFLTLFLPLSIILCLISSGFVFTP